MLDFIKSFSHLVEPNVLLDALKGGDKALSLAIGQIHYKTLQFCHSPSEVRKEGSNFSYKEALLKTPVNVVRSRPIAKSSVEENRSSNSVFLRVFGDDTQVRDLWVFLKGKGKIKNIILPKRRDETDSSC